MLRPNPNAFANSPLDRAGHRRRDGAWLKAALESDQCALAVFNVCRPMLVENGGGLLPRYLAGHVYEKHGDKTAPLIFLGLDRNETPYFACEVGDPEALAAYGAVQDLRAAGARLEADALAILGCAKSLLEWHARHGFCANCGVATQVAEAGWRRDCAACKAQHFPRVDPVAIMLPTYGEKCLLARQRMFPPRMFSALAGFFEPGETIEEAVARETLEESGLVVREVRLHSTQPWPFPSQLMIGAICDVESDQERIDPEELETGRWFTRDEARALIAGKHPDAFCPPPFAIAHHLIKTWSEG